MQRFTGQCAHCGQPSGRNEFCCSGCKLVYRLIHERSLNRYYDLKSARGIPALSIADGRARSLDWLKSISDRVRETQGVERFSLDIQGVHCAACVWLIQELFRIRPGALRIIVNPALGRLDISVSREFPTHEWVEDLERFSYRLGLVRKESDLVSRDLLVRTALCSAIALNVMIFSAAGYFGLARGGIFTFFSWLSYILVAVAVVVGGGPFISAAYLAFRRGVISFDVPVALGIVLAFASMTFVTFWSGMGVQAIGYTDSLSVFIALMVGGRWLRQRVMLHNRQHLLAEEALDQSKIKVVRASKVETICAGSVCAGETVLVGRGDILIVRGILLDPFAAISLEWISGESESRGFRTQAELPAGAINLGQPIRVQATEDYRSSALVSLIKSPDSYCAKRVTPFWHAVSSWYSVAVVCLGLGAFLGWFLLGSRSLLQSLEVSTAVLVVSCPCAFGIGAPLAYELTQSGLRRLGIFICTEGLLDRLSHVRRIAFDKTGTLTTGRLTVVNPEALDALTLEDRYALYNLCTRTSHPKSAAVASLLAEEGRFDPDLDVMEIPGAGVESRIQGKCYRLGRPAWALADSNIMDDAVSERSGAERYDLLFSRDGLLLMKLETRESLRADGESEISELSRAGYDIWILSGDAPDRVSKLAQRLGIAGNHALGRMNPLDKSRWIEVHDHHNTLFIGDGVNDCAAAARAYCSGTPAIDRPYMAARSDFYFISPGLASIRILLRAAKAVQRTIRRNLVLAAAYNTLAVGVALAGIMRPWMAAIVMPLSSVSVVGLTSTYLGRGGRVWKS